VRKIQGFVKSIVQNTLVFIGKRYNYFLIKGNLNPLNRTLRLESFMYGPWSVSMDYVRNSTLELLSKEIYEHGTKGAVAEVGVYQGEFSSLINLNFPDRKLYLFDTFEGFDERDSKSDRESNYSDMQHKFSETSISLVKSKMKFPENISIHKGWFPESAKGNEGEIFSFVSLDTDLYDPIYAGLVWFYPRLSEGGYIMIHDYNNETYRGSKEAVRTFAKEFGVTYCVLPDVGGSAVIGKPLKAKE